MSRSIGRGMTLFAVAAGVLAVVLLALALRPAPPAPTLPSPNGYDSLVRASKSVTGDYSDARSFDLAQIKGLVDADAEPLKLAKLGLSQECRIPIPASQAALEAQLQDLAGFKKLAHALAGEGRLAELENRKGDAAEAYLNTLRLGQESMRGGIIINALVGIAIEAIGASRLEPLLPHLGTNDCRKVVAALEAMERRRSSAETVLAQEQEWAYRCYGLKGRLYRIVTFKQLQKIEQNCRAKLNAQATRSRQLLVAAAARAYELDKGERPKALTDLVPDYLNAVPLDPATGTNLLYRP